MSARLPTEPARLPSLRPREKVARWWAVYRALFFIRWANVRNEWYFHVILGPAFPLGMLLFLRMLGATDEPGRALYMTAGNIILGLVLGPMQSIANDLAWAKQRHDMEYLATLPFTRLQLVLAWVSVSTVFTMPAMVLTIYLGGLLLGFSVHLSALVIPIMILSALSLAGLGVFIGVHARNGHHANIMNTLVMGTVMFLSPLLVPHENLPRLLQWTSRLLPTSYAADGFRFAVGGEAMNPVMLNLGALLAFSLLLLYLATRRLDWRVQS